MMPYFDGLTGRIAAYLCLALLFLPKINLISIGGRETAGIRFDDIVLFCFGLVFLWSRLSWRRSTFDLEKVVGAIALLSIFSFVCNRVFVALGFLHVDSSLLYALRPLEYFLFFYAGLIACSYCSLTPVVYVYFWMNALVIILQKVGIVGGFTNYGYEPDVSYRPPGLASFPSEMGVLLNIMFCYMVYRDDRGEKRRIPFVPETLIKMIRGNYQFLLFLFVGFLIVLTGSRIAVLAHLVSFAPFVWRMFRLGSPLKILGISSLIFLCIGILIVSLDKMTVLVERSSELFSWRNVDLIEEVWENIDVRYEPTGQEIVGRSGEDESWWIRVHKWMYALKIYLSNPECYLQGVGPGFAMAALDGGLLRILVELGLLGVVLFGRFFSLIARQSRALYWSVACFLINMIFFDVYLAYKSMTLLLLIAGFAYQKSTHRFIAREV